MYLAASQKHRIAVPSLVVVFFMVFGLVLGLVPAPVTAAGTFADPGMQSVWERTDMPVEQLKVSRTWMWGPSGFASKIEPYTETQGGQRTVQYFDKSRMEINNPNGDRNSQWFVTNGLLTKELITGEMQVGDNRFEMRYPAFIPVAGDPDDTTGPTYASFAALLDAQPHNPGDQITDMVDRNGIVEAGGPPTGVTAAYYVPETMHSVASVFWDFLNSSGLVYEGGRNVQGKLFDPTFFATGFPITEAYWAKVKVGGQEKWVLMQAFERRVLTYTPDNPDGWKVEMGNVGRHYYDWRYNNAGMPTVADDPGADVPADVNGSVSPKWGVGGTTFVFNISGFEPNEEVGFWVNSANGAIGGSNDTLNIGPSGGFMNLPLPISEGTDPGIYSLVFHGVQSGHEAVVYFKVVNSDQLPNPGPRTRIPPTWTLFDDSANGYKIGVPSGWNAFKGNAPEMEQFITEVEKTDPVGADGYRAAIADESLLFEAFDAAPGSRSADGTFTDYTVYRYELENPSSLEEEVLGDILALSFSGLAATPITQERIFNPDGDLIVLRFQVEREGLGNLSVTWVVGVSDSHAYLISLGTTPEQEAAYAPLFNQVIRSFQIL